MRDEVFWTIAILVWVFGWAAVWLVRRRAVEKRDLARRELLHVERMAALEKGVPLPELPAEDELLPVWLRPEAERVRAAWLARLAFFVGLVALLTGGGICAAFYLAPDTGFRGMWTIGLIPALGGVGMLLYVALARGVVPPADRARGHSDGG